jgi:hypothetical protein
MPALTASVIGSPVPVARLTSNPVVLRSTATLPVIESGLVPVAATETVPTTRSACVPSVLR